MPETDSSLYPEDPRHAPVYGIQEAAHYLFIPTATLRSWVKGRPYPTATGTKQFRPIIQLPEEGSSLLSFVNLVEAHVLAAIRRKHNIPVAKVRTAVGYVKKAFRSEHPLAEQRFETDGVDLFLSQFGRFISVSEGGQLALRELLEAHLRRVDRDPSGVPIRLFPFTRRREAGEPRVVVIDPLISFGRPVLVGTGIPTAVVAERYKAGDSIDELADDYGRSRPDIEEAIRCELSVEAA
jgi:uncharacterized protein (DUF433 family)